MIDPAVTLSLITTLYAQVLAAEQKIAALEQENAALRAAQRAGANDV
jgi:cell division protein FtsB